MTQYQLPFDNPALWDGFGSTQPPRTNPHRGLDFPQAGGTPIPSIADGTISYKGSSSVLGQVTVVEHPDGMFSGYSHSWNATTLNVGDPVARGQIVNYVGTSGSASTGNHLHLTLSVERLGVYSGQVQDPYPYIMDRLEPDPPPEPVASDLWTTDGALRPSTTITSASGLIRITVSAYGAGALVTYSIAGVRDRGEAIANWAAKTAELLLTDVSEASTSRTWIQFIPQNVAATVRVECYGLRPGAFVASPLIVVEAVA